MDYNFKRDTELFLVYQNKCYKLAIYSDIVFSQTFEELAARKKTLHNAKNFDDAVIKKANPANFSFSAPLVPEQAILVALLVGFDKAYTEANSFDLYARTTTDTYKITSCVLESGRFIISKTAVLGITIGGTGSRLKRVGDMTYSIPGVLQPIPSTNYTLTNHILVQFDGVDLDNITEVYLELRNNVEWSQNATIHYSMAVSDVENTIYPLKFVVTGRILNGSVTTYITNENTSSAQNWSTTAQIYIRVGTGGREWALQFLAPTAVFTNRTDPTEVYTQVYDFRMSSDLELSEGIT